MMVFALFPHRENDLCHRRHAISGGNRATLPQGAEPNACRAKLRSGFAITTCKNKGLQRISRIRLDATRWRRLNCRRLPHRKRKKARTPIVRAFSSAGKAVISPAVSVMRSGLLVTDLIVDFLGAGLVLAKLVEVERVGGEVTQTLDHGRGGDVFDDRILVVAVGEVRTVPKSGGGSTRAVSTAIVRGWANSVRCLRRKIDIWCRPARRGNTEPILRPLGSGVTLAGTRGEVVWCGDLRRAFARDDAL